MDTRTLHIGSRFFTRYGIEEIEEISEESPSGDRKPTFQHIKSRILLDAPLHIPEIVNNDINRGCPGLHSFVLNEPDRQIRALKTRDDFDNLLNLILDGTEIPNVPTKMTLNTKFDVDLFGWDNIGRDLNILYGYLHHAMVYNNVFFLADHVYYKMTIRCLAEEAALSFGVDREYFFTIIESLLFLSHVNSCRPCTRNYNREDIDDARVFCLRVYTNFISHHSTREDCLPSPIIPSYRTTDESILERYGYTSHSHDNPLI